MLESLIGLAFVVLFCVLAWAVQAGADAMIWGGVGLAGIGFAYGIPTAIVYHWLLYRALVRSGRLPARWWLSPTSHHDRIPLEERGRVFLWAALGGSGFAVIVLGILVASIGLWRTLAA